MSRVAMKPFAIGALLVCGAACLPQQDDAVTCSDDVTLCPAFSKDASKVTCDCECERATSLTESTSYRGSFDACLAADLNRAAATDAQRAAIDAMSVAAYSQQVYRVCDRTAEFLQAVARTQLGGRTTPLCVAPPVSCKCRAVAAWRDGVSCDAPCKDVVCSPQNCAPLIRQHNTLQTESCACTRVELCSRTVPAADQPAICHFSPRLP